jgi:adenine-specific DNA-methyltransferase
MKEEKTEIEKLNLGSMDIAEEKRNELLRLFPEIRTEGGKIDFEKLKITLGQMVDVGKERYSVTWPGKSDCFKTIQAPSLGTLRPAYKDSVNFELSENLFIEGDNLEVLKLLQKSYLNKVKLIFIDPPYNTGNDFIYPDDYSENLQTYLEYTSQVDSQGKRFGTNLETDGRFHSKWLSMMYPRLYLARNLLTDDGCICIMISDVEYANLRSLMNDIFGEENYINTISVLTKVAAGASGGGEDRRLKKNIEYLIIYAKNAAEFTTLTHMYSEQPLMDVIQEMRTNDESWKYTSILLDAGTRVPFAETKDGEGNPIQIFKRRNVKRTTINKVCKEEKITEEEAYSKYFDKIFSDTNAQTSIRTRVIEAAGNLEDNELLEVEYVPRSGKDKGKKVIHSYISNTVRRVIWLYDVAEVRGGRVVKKEKLGTLWNDIDFNNVGKEGEVPFPNGKKPIQLIERCLELVNDKSGIVMDFFGGSCSTAHATMHLNAKDNGTRRFLVIQLPESVHETDSSLETLIDFCKSQKTPLNIAEIGKERIRRSIKQIENEFADLKEANGFKVFKLSDSSFKTWDHEASKGNLAKQLELHLEHVKPDRAADDILYEILLKSGFPLTTKVEAQKIDNQTIYSIADGMLLVCLEEELTLDLIKYIADQKPERVVCLDHGFANNDQLKANAVQIFRTKGIASFKTV